MGGDCCDADFRQQLEEQDVDERCELVNLLSYFYVGIVFCWLASLLCILYSPPRSCRLKQMNVELA